MNRLWLCLLCLIAPLGAQAAGPDDVVVRTEVLRITDVSLGDDYQEEVGFVRSTLHVDLGFGSSTLGLMVHNATKENDVTPGQVETGLMLTAGYNWILNSHFRLDAATRLGVVETDPGNPLYATDTDVRVNLVAFSPEGAWLWNHRTGHPSAYVGTIVNRYGRAQLLAGAGAWWNQIGVYVTAFESLNGVDDPMDAGDDHDRRFGFLKSRGVSFSGSYNLGPVEVGMRKNISLRNGGNDLVFSLQWQREFGEVYP